MNISDNSSGVISNCVLIIGCGNIGSRLLQSLGRTRTRCGQPLTIYALEPDASARQIAQERLNHANTNNASLLFISSILEAPTEIDLLIIATNSRERLSALSTAMKHARFQAIVLEKILFVSLEEFRSANEILGEKNLKTWVNCTRNVWPGYVALKSELKNAGAILSISVKGSDWNMASNAIHFLSLMEYLTADKISTLTLVENDAEIRASKRKGYQEITGKLLGTFANHGSFDLQSYATGSAPLKVSIHCANKSFEIHEAEHRIVDSASKQDSPFGILRTSDLSPVFEAIIDKQHCNLPAYDDSARLHKLIFRAIHSLMVDYVGESLVYPIT